MREDLPVLDQHLLPYDLPHDLCSDAEQLGEGGVRVVEAPVLESAEAWRQRLQAPSSFTGSETKLALSFLPEAGFGTFHRPQEPANTLGACKSMFLHSACSTRPQH